jgi:hypothetical protein
MEASEQHDFSKQRLFVWLVWIQSIYTFLTAVWPLVHIESFMLVTGYKTDIWLVKTVGALLIPIAVSLFSHLFTEGNHWPAVFLGALTAAAFICVDFYYALNDVIRDIYMADGFVEILFLLCWLFIASSNLRNSR